MDRRLFLSGMLGIAGAAAIAGMARPGKALAGVPETGSGILDQLDAPAADPPFEEAETQAEPAQYSSRRHHRRHRRRVWRRVCRRYWYRGRYRRRCYRRRVWIT